MGQELPQAKKLVRLYESIKDAMRCSFRGKEIISPAKAQRAAAF